jgi:hypothetical protein
MCLFIQQIDELPMGLRIAWGCCAATVGVLLALFCIYMALNAARAHAVVTVDDEAMKVEQFGLIGVTKRRWLRNELKMIAFGKEGEGLLVQSVTGNEEVILRILKPGALRQEIAVALRARLGMPEYFSSNEVFGEFAPIMDSLMKQARPTASSNRESSGSPSVEMDLFVESALAECGGRIEFSLPEEIGGRVVEAKIPAGIRAGQKLRFTGVGVGGQDLIVTLRILPKVEGGTNRRG